MQVPKDSQTAVFKDYLAFLGLTDVSFVYAEALANGRRAAIKPWECG